MDSSPVLTVSDFLREYKIGRTKAYAEIKAQRLHVIKVGGRTLIRRSDAEAWLSSYEEPALQAA